MPYNMLQVSYRTTDYKTKPVIYAVKLTNTLSFYASVHFFYALSRGLR